MVQVALAKGHKKADALDVWQVLAQRFNFLVVQQVHILLTDLVKVIFPLDAHSRDLDPLAVFHIAAGGQKLRAG